MKFIYEDRVLHLREEVHFDSFQDAWCSLFARLCGAPKIVDLSTNDDGDDVFVIHNYLDRKKL